MASGPHWPNATSTTLFHSEKALHISKYRCTTSHWVLNMNRKHHHFLCWQMTPTCVLSWWSFEDFDDSCWTFHGNVLIHLWRDTVRSASCWHSPTAPWQFTLNLERLKASSAADPWRRSSDSSSDVTTMEVSCEATSALDSRFVWPVLLLVVLHNCSKEQNRGVH